MVAPPRSGAIRRSLAFLRDVGPHRLVSNAFSAREPVCAAPENALTSVAMIQAQRPGHDVDPKLLEILVCPLTKAPLEYDRDRQELVSRAARLAYPIRDGIPIMLADEARKLDESELTR